MIPALLFFICMIAYYPQIGSEALPSDFLLQRLNFPAFHYLFQLMIFLALLESGTGCVHAFNERIAEAYAARKGGSLSKSARLWITGALLAGLDILGGAIRTGDFDRARLSRPRLHVPGGIRAAGDDPRGVAAVHAQQDPRRGRSEPVAASP